MMPSPSLTTENTKFTEEGTEKNNSVDAHIIGQIQLEAAIEHYNKGNYICAITLARAAEEYLGKLLKYSKGIEPVLNPLRKSISEVTGLELNELNLNYIANCLKHFEEDFCETEHNIRLDSVQLILRSLNNFVALEIPLSGIMKEFSNLHTPTHIDSIITSVPSSVNSVSSVVKKSDEDLNLISGKIVNCAINVHKQLGAGLLESAYQHGMAYALAKEGLKFEKEKPVSIVIDNHKLDAGYRADFIVENSIILEIKSVEKLAHNHDAQILNYMRLGKFKLGLLMNFNEMLLKNGLKRFKI